MRCACHAFLGTMKPAGNSHETDDPTQICEERWGGGEQNMWFSFVFPENQPSYSISPSLARKKHNFQPTKLSEIYAQGSLAFKSSKLHAGDS